MAIIQDYKTKSEVGIGNTSPNKSEQCLIPPQKLSLYYFALLGENAFFSIGTF